MNSYLMERIDAAGDCWEWTGNISVHGYGKIKQRGPLRDTMAHRAVYEMLAGPIPAGLQIDHLCRNTSCVNPDHLEPVTNQENTRRGSSYRAKCRKGHTDWTSQVNGSRLCRTCRASRRAA